MRLSEMMNFPFPPDMTVWNAARKLIVDEDKVVMRAFGACASQDPVIVMEFLRVGNGMEWAPKEGQVTTTVQEAATRIGTDLSIQALSRVACRRDFKNPEVQSLFERYRSRCKRASILARILAQTVVRRYANECQTSASMISVGDMLAVAVFQEEYAEMAKTMSRAAISYRLGQTQRFAPEQMGLRYLEHAGVPLVLITMVDRDAEIEIPARALCRTVCFAAAEMIDAFDADRWDRLEPGKILPPKSYVRSL